jgi:nicotinamide riboside transporter PnuC
MTKYQLVFCLKLNSLIFFFSGIAFILMIIKRKENFGCLT